VASAQQVSAKEPRKSGKEPLISVKELCIS